MDDFERRWKRIHDQLLIQANGTDPRPLASNRTLFGIRSEIEEKMDRFAHEIEEEQREKHERERNARPNGHN